MQKEQSIKTKDTFEDFNNLYTINKTLRFSLIPYRETLDILKIEEEKNNFKNDREIAKFYKQIKQILDEFHSEFIDEAMKDFSFDEKKELKEFEDKYIEFIKAKKDTDNKKFFQSKEKELSDLTKKLEKKICEQFSLYKSDKYKYSKFDKDNKSKDEALFTKENIFGKKVLILLKIKYKNKENELNIIKYFDDFSTYLGGYNENRKNYYKAENKAGQFATRVIDENLIQFLKNKHIFENKYKKDNKNIRIKNIEIFELSYFNNLFLQSELDKYNGIISGEKKKENKGENANSGINEEINLYRQKKSKDKHSFKSSDFPFFKELYKQIGSIKNKMESNFIEINSDDTLIEELKKFPNYTRNYIMEIKKFYENFFENLFNKNYESINKIYIPKKTGTELSNLIFNDWEKIENLYRKGRKDKEGNEVKEKKISLADLKEKMDDLKNFDFKQLYKDKLKIGSTDKIFLDFIKVWQFEINSLFEGFEYNNNEKEKIKKDTLKILEEQYIKSVKSYEKKISEKKPLNDKEKREIIKDIKDYLDRILDIDKTIKYFDLGKDEYKNIDEFDKEPLFYDEFDKIKTKQNKYRIYTYYDEFRNYITKRNINTDKFKLNFDDGQLLSGFDLNKEMEKFGVMFRDNDRYYLGIINKNKDKKILDKKSHPEIFIDNSNFQKMEYKFLGDTKRQLPRIFFTKNENKEHIIPIFLNGKERDEMSKIKKEYNEFQDDKKENKDKWKDEFDREKLNKLISYYQKGLEIHQENYKKTYNLKWKKPSEYKNLGEFNDDIAKQTYKVKFVGINKDYIDEKVKNSELYLFQINNKDFSKKKGKNSTDNLETIYFKELFSKENLKDPIFKMSGGAEIFFRDKIEKHKEETKKDNKGKVVIAAKRYTKNIILFHLPIVINYDIKNVKKFNNVVNDFIVKNSKKINIIGIDRGEKHLLYYSLINADGKIEKIKSLNAVSENGDFIDPDILEEFEENEKIKWRYKNQKGKYEKVTDYQKKLAKIEENKQEQRKNWQTIEGIKNMKKGYLSLVVKKIADMAIENNAIVILEDLNNKFKTGRQKIERNVYQQFEKALIDKLNFVVDKKKQNQRNAPQLSAPFKSFKEIGKQTGIIFYVGASYTSKICPQCNWQRNIYVHYNGILKTKESYTKYNLNIFYEEDKNRFKFKYIGNDKEKSVVYSDIDRFFWDKKANKGRGEVVEYSDKYKISDGIKNFVKQKGSITENLKNIFDKQFTAIDKENCEGFNLDLKNSKNIDIFKKIKNDYLAKGKNNSERWKSLVFFFNKILEIRNSINDKNRSEDNIICPSCYFDSRKSNVVKNGDANGAYNIAKKGLMIINQIKKKNPNPNLYFKNEEYKKFIKNKKVNI